MNPAPCCCGAATVDAWTAGVHHGAHRCARVITRIESIGTEAALGARKVHLAWMTPDGRAINLCGVLSKRGRSRSEDVAMVTCEKCLAFLRAAARHLSGGDA